MTELPPGFDPYRNCEEDCNHDVGRGMLIAELTLEGPWRPGPRPAGLKAAVIAALQRTQWRHAA